MTRRIFRGATVFDGRDLHAASALVVEDGVVVGLVPAALPMQGDVVALPGGTLAPGFVDLQVNGGGGVMLNDAASVEGIATICAAHGRLGTTGLLPTLITDRPDVTAAVIDAGIAAAGRVPGFLGLHLEGPHLDPRRRGAHDPALIRPMTEADLSLLVAAARQLPALLVTLAPASATLGQIAALADAGALVSLGHSDAGFDEAVAVFASGARAVTHLFNAMSPLGHREPGVVGAALDTDVSAGIIADGIHVAVPALRAALRSKTGTDRMFVVTDAMAVAGTAQTAFRLNGREILRRDGRLTLADGTLAGADVDMATSLRVLVGQVGISLAAALRMATAVPAALIGARTGRLEPGWPADLVHLDGDLRLAGVWRGGRPLADQSA